MDYRRESIIRCPMKWQDGQRSNVISEKLIRFPRTESPRIQRRELENSSLHDGKVRIVIYKFLVDILTLFNSLSVLFRFEKRKLFILFCSYESRASVFSVKLKRINDGEQFWLFFL